MGDERSVTLEEDLDLTHDPLVRDAQGNGYAAEFVFTVLRTRPGPGRRGPRVRTREMTTKQRLRPGCTAPTAFGRTAASPLDRSGKVNGSTRVLTPSSPICPALWLRTATGWSSGSSSATRRTAITCGSGVAGRGAQTTRRPPRPAPWARGLVSDGLLSRFRVVDYRPEWAGSVRRPGLSQAAFEVFEASSRFAAALAGCSAEVAALGVQTAGTDLVAQVRGGWTPGGDGADPPFVTPSRHPARAQFRAERSRALR